MNEEGGVGGVRAWKEGQEVREEGEGGGGREEWRWREEGREGCICCQHSDQAILQGYGEQKYTLVFHNLVNYTC